MPELPEVETVRRGLEPVLVGARLAAVAVRQPALRFPLPPDFAARLTGRRIATLTRRAKYLIATLDDGDALLMHLGMSGSFRITAGKATQAPGVFHHPRNSAATHDHVVFDLSGGTRVTYNDPRRFGFMKLVAADALADEPLLAALGPEPLGNDFDATTLAAALAGKQTSLKAALLDQHVVAGLGNIYVCEALHRAGLSPRRPAAVLATRGKANAKTETVVAAIRAVLNEAIAAGGSSLRDHRRPDGELGYFQHTFRVYDREAAPCPTPGCTGTVKRVVQNGRSTFWCPKCQR